MRVITTIGLGVLVVGALLLAASIGAFDSMNADRGIDIKTVDDDQALLGLEYDDELSDRTLELRSEDRDDTCILEFCNQYHNRELVSLEDNIKTTNLEITVATEATGENPTVIEQLNHNDGVVYGNFRCLSIGGQASRSATVLMTVEATSEDVTINLEREIHIQCIPD